MQRVEGSEYAIIRCDGGEFQVTTQRPRLLRSGVSTTPITVSHASTDVFVFFGTGSILNTVILKRILVGREANQVSRGMAKPEERPFAPGTTLHAQPHPVDTIVQFEMQGDYHHRQWLCSRDEWNQAIV